MITSIFERVSSILSMAVILFLVNSKSYAIASDFFYQNIYCNGLNSSIEKYACLTDHAVKGIEINFASNGIHLESREIVVLKALEAMNLVQNIASSARYNYLTYMQAYLPLLHAFNLSTDNFQTPSMDNQDICLKNGFGLCGNHQFIFISLLKHIGVRARAVDFYYSLNGQRYSHAAAEVNIENDKWVYFDITWGSYWRNNPQDLLIIKPLEEVLNGKGTQITSSNSWYIATAHQFSLLGLPSLFSYLNAKDLQIIRNKGGTLVVSFDNDKANFSNQPHHFGKTKDYSPLQIKLAANVPAGDAILDISALGGKCKNSFMKIGSRHYPIINGKNRITISPNAMIKIEGKDETCYAIIASLKMITN